MIKSKDKKTNPLDQIAKRIEKYVETYDNPMSVTDTYDLYKSTATPAERKEFEKIEEGAKPAKERKAYKAKMAALDAQLKVSLLTPIPTTVTQPEPKNTYLDDLETQRKDPDLFRGLGTFLHKKI